MFSVSEAEAAAIRAAFEQSGELAAVIEVRRLFPGIADNATVRACALTIAGWQPPTSPPSPISKLRPRKRPQPAD